MPVPQTIETNRLLLRRWRDSDLAPFAVMNADPRVMEFFPAVLTAEESHETAAHITQHFDQHGFGLWAVEVPGVVAFAGFVGLSVPRFEARFMPCVEIGWRLAADHWGAGYATEGARATLQFAFESLHLQEVVSMTAVANQRSRRVMQKIGMMHDDCDDFDHPLVADGHALQRHVLYRIDRQVEPI